MGEMLSGPMMQTNGPLPPLHHTQERLLRFLSELGHGTVQVKVVDGRPVMIEHAVKQIKLD